MTTGYAKDILPVFRTGDIGCMTPKGIRLGDAHGCSTRRPTTIPTLTF
jgi:hypothetical protein